MAGFEGADKHTNPFFFQPNKSSDFFFTREAQNQSRTGSFCLEVSLYLCVFPAPSSQWKGLLLAVGLQLNLWNREVLLGCQEFAGTQSLHLREEFIWPCCCLPFRSQALVRDAVVYFLAKDYGATYREGEGLHEGWAGCWDRQASGRAFSFVL